MRLPAVFSKKYALPIAAGASGVVNGLFVGYILGRRQIVDLIEAIEKVEPGIMPDENQLEIPFEADEEEQGEFISFERPTIDRPTRVVISEEEADRLALEDRINDMGLEDPVVQEALRRTIGSPNHEEVREAAEEAIVEYAPEDEATSVQSIFDTPHGTWSYEEEEKKRGNRDPYVIHQDEYMADDSGCRQAALMYYAGDNVVVDDDNKPVSNYQELVGDLEGDDAPWGHGSRNEDMVYVRNPRIECEYEIVRTYEAFALAVQGFEADAELDEIQHSADRRRRRPAWQD